jgi:hypothetical protein
VRLTGAVILLVGLVTAVVGAFRGCGALFAWNGRHAIAVDSLAASPFSRTLVPEAGCRYTLSIQVVFDREGLPVREGVVVVEAKMPLVVRVKDGAGTTLAETNGWLDPNEPPNVLYGQAATAGRSVAHAAELVVERLVGPFAVSSGAPISVDVNLGPDRLGSARILDRRLVIHDDRLPSAIHNSFVVGAIGATSSVVGVALLLVGWLQRRSRGNRDRRRRDEAPARPPLL